MIRRLIDWLDRRLSPRGDPPRDCDRPCSPENFHRLEHHLRDRGVWLNFWPSIAQARDLELWCRFGQPRPELWLYLQSRASIDRCVQCGCTEDDRCIQPRDGSRCRMTADGLCSICEQQFDARQW